MSAAEEGKGKREKQKRSPDGRFWRDTALILRNVLGNLHRLDLSGEPVNLSEPFYTHVPNHKIERWLFPFVT